jgi:hypothetical protein
MQEVIAFFGAIGPAVLKCARLMHIETSSCLTAGMSLVLECSSW